MQAKLKQKILNKVINTLNKKFKQTWKFKLAKDHGPWKPRTGNWNQTEAFHKKTLKGNTPEYSLILKCFLYVFCYVKLVLILLSGEIWIDSHT